MRLFNSQYLHQQRPHIAPSYRGRDKARGYGGRGSRSSRAPLPETGNDVIAEADTARAILQQMAQYDRAA